MSSAGGDGKYGRLGNGATPERQSTPVDVRTSDTESAALSGVTAIDLRWSS